MNSFKFREIVGEVCTEFPDLIVSVYTGGCLHQEFEDKLAFSSSGRVVLLYHTFNKLNKLNSINIRSCLTSFNKFLNKNHYNSLDEHLSRLQSDAPFCSECGHLTVRSATCFKCLNCGSSMGCS